jgi:excisionase family DNA binding protein
VPRVPSDWITLSEAVELFRAANVTVTTSTLARWVAAGRLQSIRPGRRIYVRRAQVRALLTPRRPAVHVEDLQPGLFETAVEPGRRSGRA